MPTVLAFPRPRRAAPAPQGLRPAARGPVPPSAAPVPAPVPEAPVPAGHRPGRGAAPDLLAAAFLGLLPAEARLEALFDRLEAQP